MRIAPRRFREVMSRFATGVTVVAATDPISGAPSGLTANAVCSVSLDPPLILVCVSRRGYTHEIIHRAGYFSINVLAEKQLDASAVFAAGGCPDKFASVPHRAGSTGTPLLRDSLAWLECGLWATYPGGDHTIFVGQVLYAGGNGDGKRPLVFYEGSYASLASGAPQSVAAST